MRGAQSTCGTSAERVLPRIWKHTNSRGKSARLICTGPNIYARLPQKKNQASACSDYEPTPERGFCLGCQRRPRPEPLVLPTSTNKADATGFCLDSQIHLTRTVTSYIHVSPPLQRRVLPRTITGPATVRDRNPTHCFRIQQFTQLRLDPHMSRGGSMRST